ncbi:OTU domain-containing protein [Cucumis melo var. makuwa]|uniref:Ubiquitin thioesterase OTU n=1 Tax=Cucumis melo var. makuwa TaxID=1194695 RepID=A0A5D3DFL5_CUCMM|nr:OTU domain-containing protein [Cucumis melo var. makuwa]
MSTKERDLGTSTGTLARLTSSTIPIRLGCCLASVPVLHRLIGWMQVMRVTGVLADGRWLFRAIAHGACLRSGEEAPDDDRQRELADELRAKARLEFMHNHPFVGDFDVYVMRIQQPFVWGGEPELLMVSHVLKQVFIYIASHNFVS